jgi:hypothetical protein
MRARKETRALAHVLREAPYQWHETMELMRRGQFEVGFVHKGIDDFTHRLEHAFNRLVVALVVAGGLVGDVRPGLAVLEIAVGIAAASAFALVEPATTRAAFRSSDGL